MSDTDDMREVRVAVNGEEVTLRYRELGTLNPYVNFEIHDGMGLGQDSGASILKDEEPVDDVIRGFNGVLPDGVEVNEIVWKGP